MFGDLIANGLEKFDVVRVPRSPGIVFRRRQAGSRPVNGAHMGPRDRLLKAQEAAEPLRCHAHIQMKRSMKLLGLMPMS